MNITFNPVCLYNSEYNKPFYKCMLSQEFECIKTLILYYMMKNTIHNTLSEKKVYNI